MSSRHQLIFTTRFHQNVSETFEVYTIVPRGGSLNTEHYCVRPKTIE